jgi:aryl-alcohol dehydrogenase-like predicted oxidoreductase
VIATKVFFPMNDRPNMGGLSRKHIQQACEASLRRLGVDAIDLYQIHRADPNTPMEETLAALDQLVTQGKVRALARFATMQNHYNLVYREEEREMMPLCESQGIGVIPWSPLARGMLAGSRKALGDDSTARSQSDGLDQILYDQPSDWDVVEAVKDVAKQRGARPAQVALAWLLAKPAVRAPIVGATKLEHLDDAVAALEIELSEAETAALEAPYRPHPVKGLARASR